MGAAIPPILLAAGSLYAVLNSAAGANKGPAINNAGTGWEMRDLSSAALLTTGTLADARLSANVPLLNAANVFAGTLTVNANSFLNGHAHIGTGTPTGFVTGIHTVEITATGSSTPLTLIGGSGLVELWSDTTPTSAAMVGLGTNNVTSTNLQFSTYNATSNWQIRGEFLNSDGRFSLRSALNLTALSATPTNPASSSDANEYIKGGKKVIQYNDGGTVRYKYLDLTGTGVTWVHTTVAP